MGVETYDLHINIHCDREYFKISIVENEDIATGKAGHITHKMQN